MKKLLLLSLIVIFALPLTSRAQNATIKNTLGIGPRLGYYKADDAESGNFYGGAQLRLRMGPVLGLEGSVEYRAGQEYGVGNYTVTTRFVPVTGSALFFIPVSKHFAPYGVAGIGAYYTAYDYSSAAEALGSQDDSSFNMGYHLGFGVELPVNSNVAFNVDYRYLFLNPTSNEQNLDDASFSGNEFTAGLTFYL